MTEHQALPVAGYTPQSDARVQIVNLNKEMEERLLRRLEGMLDAPHHIDGRWLSIARTHFEQGFMALNRAIFQPQRLLLPEDPPQGIVGDKPYPEDVVSASADNPLPRESSR